MMGLCAIECEGMSSFMITARIAALACAVPKEQVDLMHLGFDAETMQRTMKLTGVHTVRYAPPGKTAADYCLRAAQEILEKTNIQSETIDGIVFATPHPDYIYPGNCSIIQKELDLSKKCVVMDVNHSCTGMVYGLYLADLLVRSGDARNVLVCCGDTASHHLHPKDRALRMVVGDGGAAALVSRGGRKTAQYSFCHDGSGLRFLYTPAGGERMPRCAGITDVEKTDAEGNIRTLEDEYMDGMEVMRFVLNEVPMLIDDVLAKSGWCREDAAVYAMHQANEFILKSLMRAMHLKKDAVLVDIDGYGNIGGASLVLALCHAHEKPHEPWGKAVLAGFGTGLSGAAMAADLTDTDIFRVLEC